MIKQLISKIKKKKFKVGIIGLGYVGLPLAARFINENIGATFYGKYQANRLITYKDSMDFSLEELEYISKSSPLHSQQLILPAFEIERLTKKFANYTNYEKINPELIIINNNNPNIQEDYAEIEWQIYAIDGA